MPLPTPAGWTRSGSRRGTRAPLDRSPRTAPEVGTRNVGRHEEPRASKPASVPNPAPRESGHGEGGVVRPYASAMDTLAVADRLSSLKVPARVVWGTADKFQTIAYGERLARDLGVEVRRIEGALHFTPEDHPEVIAAAVAEVLDEVRS